VIGEAPSRALRAELARRKSTLKLLPGGFGGVMDLLDAWVASVDARLTLLEGQGGAVAQFSAQLSEDQIKARQRPDCGGCDD
jgi:hypothetical protein